MRFVVLDLCDRPPVPYPCHIKMVKSSGDPRLRFRPVATADYRGKRSNREGFRTTQRPVGAAHSRIADHRGVTRRRTSGFVTRSCHPEYD
jgi:hypothetical protein